MILNFQYISGKDLQKYCCLCSTENLEYLEFSMLRNPSNEAFLIKDSSKVIGHLVFNRNKTMATIKLLCIRKNYQCKKIGEQAVLFFIENCKAQGIKCIRLIPNDSRSEKFYLKLNFKIKENDNIYMYYE